MMIKKTQIKKRDQCTLLSIGMVIILEKEFKKYVTHFQARDMISQILKTLIHKLKRLRLLLLTQEVYTKRLKIL